MSKFKNQNKNNNKSSKVPVKSQPMKPQKGAAIKPVQVTANKNNQKAVAKSAAKPVAKPIAKPIAKAIATKIPEAAKKQLKPTKKDADIAESDEDEDEDDVEFDSDIDDVDLGDSDDEDMEDDDDDLSIEDLDGSDIESFEDNVDSNDESEDDENKPEPIKVVEKKEPKKAVEKKEPAKAVEKKEPAKAVEKKDPAKAVEKKEPAKAVEKKEPTKAVEKKEPAKAVEKKEPAKVVEKKEPAKAVENKEPVKKEEKIIDPTTKEGKVLIEINKRKNYFNDVVIFITKISSNFTREALTNILKENKLSIISINLPGKMKKKGLQLRGYGFARFAKIEDAKKAIDIINSHEIDGKKMKAAPYVCRKIYNDINKVIFSKLIAQTFEDKDITDAIAKHYKSAKVTKYMNTQYGLEFPSKEEANKIFNEETVTIEGSKMVFNYLYAEKSNLVHDAAEIPEVAVKRVAEPEPIEAKKAEKTVKAGVKRSNCESSSDEEEEVVKKTKMIDGTESANKVEKKVETPKKSISAVKTPEIKIPTPKNNKEGKKENKSPANGKAHFNKSPLDKKQFNKQSPAGNKGKNSPGNKKFNKK